MSKDIRCTVIGRTCPYASDGRCDTGGKMMSQAVPSCVRNNHRQIAETCLSKELDVVAHLLNSLAEDVGLSIGVEDGKVILGVIQNIGDKSVTAHAVLNTGQVERPPNKELH